MFPITHCAGSTGCIRLYALQRGLCARHVIHRCHVPHVIWLTSHILFAASLPPASYSDTPFDAFVSFSNVIVRPFFQNHLKRKEVSRKRDAVIASFGHVHLGHSVFSQENKDQRHHLFLEIFRGRIMSLAPFHFHHTP